MRGRHYVGMCNIGHNPTFNFNHQICIETYILDFDADIYGEELILDFCAYLRDEQRFSSIEKLMEQLAFDRQLVRSYFKLDLQ